MSHHIYFDETCIIDNSYVFYVIHNV